MSGERVTEEFVNLGQPVDQALVDRVSAQLYQRGRLAGGRVRLKKGVVRSDNADVWKAGDFVIFIYTTPKDPQ
jgi:hypothetical protein